MVCGAAVLVSGCAVADEGFAATGAESMNLDVETDLWLAQKETGMSKFIERVAAAMAEKANGGKFIDPLFYAPEHKAFWMEVVEAGIAFMRREPPKELVRWGTDYIWQAMLDEALRSE